MRERDKGVEGLTRTKTRLKSETNLPWKEGYINGWNGA
jgi:hypothetical protein